MTKPPPYQPTQAQMQAQSQAQRLIQQQAFIQVAQNQQITQAQLQQAQMAQQAGGVQNVGHWLSNQTPPCGPAGPAYIAYLGTNGTFYPVSVQTTSGTIQGTGGTGIAMAQCQPVIELEECGVRAGEIIAYRAWRLCGNKTKLHSMFVDYFWESDEPQKIGGNLNPYHGNGFHAFKTLEKTKQEYGFIPGVTPTTVYGEVALWGEVIEHERGYRAECARVTRILEVRENIVGDGLRRLFGTRTIDKLRQLYGVKE